MMIIFENSGRQREEWGPSSLRIMCLSILGFISIFSLKYTLSSHAVTLAMVKLVVGICVDFPTLMPLFRHRNRVGGQCISVVIPENRMFVEKPTQRSPRHALLASETVTRIVVFKIPTFIGCALTHSSHGACKIWCCSILPGFSSADRAAGET
jgi:hypothetical protein